MSDQPNGNGQTQAAEPSFNAHDMVSEMLGGIRSSIGAKVLPPSESQESVVTDEQQPAVEQAAPEQPAPLPQPEDEVAKLKAELERSHKSFNGMQSTLDKRIAAQLKQRDDQIANLTNTVQQLLTHLQGQNAPEEWHQQQQLQQNQAAQQQAIEAMLEQKLSNDPRVQAGGVVYDWAAFRQARPDSYQYDPIINKFLERFPPKPGVGLYDHLMSAMTYIDDLKDLAAANAGGVAAGNAQPQPTQQSSQPPANKITAQQAQLLAQKANTFRQEQGQSATNPTKPNINYGGRLDPAIDAIVENFMRGRR